MASPQSPSGFRAFDASVLDDLVDSESSSSRSYVGSDESTHERAGCPWRTSNFHDQECSRYFDCPSHLVERRLSVDPADSDQASQGRGSPASSDININPEYRHDSGREFPAEEEEEQADIYSSSPRRGPPQDLNNPTPTTPPRRPETPISDPDPDVPTSVNHLWSTSSRAQLEPALDEPGSSSRQPARSQEEPTNLIDGPEVRPESEAIEDPNSAPSSQTPQFRYQPVSRGIMDDLVLAADQTEQGLPPLPRPQEGEERRASDVQLPRWQPDAEVTYCPICRTQFSFFVRKHHCRKCGRVVCNSCSPHRIIIPYQYIVRPDGSEVAIPQALLIDGLGAGYFDVNNMSGGERVRLCNPCVPDPNTAPPQSPNPPAASSPRTSHQRSRSSNTYGPVPASNRHGAIFAPGPANEYRYLTHRTRSITMGHPAVGSSHATSSRRRSGANLTPAERLLASIPTESPSSSYPSRRSSLNHPAAASSSSSSRQRALPPTPQIAEEDECPICHRELPSRDLANYQTLRETHITSCIQTHSAYGTPRGNEPPAAPRRTGMYTYSATEKDCIDDAECTICLEEFTVGVPMARLECLCRFHRSCISAWFVNHPGRCPVHQHDGFGY